MAPSLKSALRVFQDAGQHGKRKNERSAHLSHAAFQQSQTASVDEATAEVDHEEPWRHHRGGQGSEDGH